MDHPNARDIRIRTKEGALKNIYRSIEQASDAGLSHMIWPSNLNSEVRTYLLQKEFLLFTNKQNDIIIFWGDPAVGPVSVGCDPATLKAITN